LRHRSHSQHVTITRAINAEKDKNQALHIIMVCEKLTQWNKQEIHNHERSHMYKYEIFIILMNCIKWI